MARMFHSIQIRCDLGVTVEALRCVAGAMAAALEKNKLELDIELSALAALREIQAMKRRAMVELGLAERGYSEIRFVFEPMLNEALRTPPGVSDFQ